MNQSKLRRFLPLLALLAVVLVVAAAPAGAQTQHTVDVQILAVNDFHGNLLPPTGSSGRVTIAPGVTVDAGGVEYLATHVNALRAANPNTLFVSAGDMIGATPLLSALFHDEPTIEAFNYMDLDFNAVGNHEFDEGLTELLRMQNGGCHPVDGCQDGDGFEGADFQYLAANVTYESNGRTIFPPYGIKTFDGIKVAFIGMTLEGTPNIVTPSGIAGLDFHDEADTANALIRKLKKLGVETIVVLIHEGGFPTGLYNECPGISGPIVDIVERTDPEVDLFITGHTHQGYNCIIDGRPVSSALSFGRLVTDIDLKINRASREPESISVNNVIVTRTVTPDSFLTQLIADYNAIAAPLANRVIGSITGDITRAATPAGESALGDVIADGQLDATDDPGFGDAVVAFMNPGGIRADLIYSQISGGEQPGEVTYGEMFTVQPFGNSLVTMTLTGAQIETLLEQQFTGCVPGTTANRILQVSNGFTYSWSLSAPACSKVDPATIKINGVTVDPNASYRVTVNSFLADGGDSFPILVQGTDRLGGAVDTDAFEAYFAANSPVPPGPQNRITQVP
jgi:5'-nucleotidase